MKVLVSRLCHSRGGECWKVLEPQWNFSSILRHTFLRVWKTKYGQEDDTSGFLPGVTEPLILALQGTNRRLVEEVQKQTEAVGYNLVTNSATFFSSLFTSKNSKRLNALRTFDCRPMRQSSDAFSMNQHRTLFSTHPQSKRCDHSRICSVCNDWNIESWWRVWHCRNWAIWRSNACKRWSLRLYNLVVETPLAWQTVDVGHDLQNNALDMICEVQVVNT